jgi:hypothetical protein
MYNFRYHLVTICSIFIALAIGLLLGAAVAGSDLARSTSDSMVDSMLARFDELNNQNAKLESLSNENGLLADEFAANWAKNRLDGRTVVTLLGSSEADATLSKNLSDNLKRSNAAVVGITVNQSQFGLDNPAIKQALQKVLPAVQGEDYQATLANRLVAEWSYSYTTSEGDAPTAADTQIQKVTYPIVYVDTNQKPSEAESGIMDQPLLTDDGISPQTPFQETIYQQYSLTRALLTLGVITVDTNYQPLLDHTMPVIPDSQNAALQVAEAWHLPYAVNGLVNGLSTIDSNDLLKTSSVGITISSKFNEFGSANKLSYPAWLKASIPIYANSGTGLTNYYVLLIQDSSLETDITSEAISANLSCVTTPNTITGNYAILALLSGAKAGIYGEDRPQESRFPKLPVDTTGRAAFAGD